MEEQLFQKLLQHKALRSFVHLRGDMNTVDLRVFNPGFLIPTQIHCKGKFYSAVNFGFVKQSFVHLWPLLPEK